VARKKPSGERSVRWSRPKYAPKRKVCIFCADKSAKINYRDPDKLRSYISDRAKILPRRRTGTCARHQRSLAVAIKRARHLALLPYVPAHMRKVGGIAPTPARTPAAAPTPAPARVTEPVATAVKEETPAVEPAPAAEETPVEDQIRISE
jgi:small subunit ribosomal protein S18